MIILGPKTAILGPRFCRILVLGPHFWWSGGGPGPPGPPPWIRPWHGQSSEHHVALHCTVWLVSPGHPATPNSVCGMRHVLFRYLVPRVKPHSPTHVDQAVQYVQPTVMVNVIKLKAMYMVLAGLPLHV